MLREIISDPTIAWRANTIGQKEITYTLDQESVQEFIRNGQNYLADNLPKLRQEIDRFREDYLDRNFGFGIINACEDLTQEQQVNLYYLMVKGFGDMLTQNINGEKVVEVKDRGEGTMGDGRRYHQTRQGGSLHTDSPQWENVPDYFGLFCTYPAESGGESKLISAYSLHNLLLGDHPQTLSILYENFYFDKRGEFREGESPVTRAPIFAYLNGNLTFRYLSDYIRAGHERVNEPLTRLQREALDTVDNLLTSSDLIFTFKLDQSQMVFVNNLRTIHGRTDFVDFEDQSKQRILLRTWIRGR